MILFEEISIKIIGEDAIEKINYDIVGSKRDKDSTYRSCFSSYYYYETDEEQISSIVLSLVKGHYFMDGNKRTAFIVFTALCKFNNIELRNSDDYYSRVFIEIAENDYTVEKVAKLLFK